MIRRISSARFAELGQPVSTHDSSATGSTEMLQALNERSSTLSSGTAPKTKEEAALKTMRSLEGVRHSSQLEKAKGNHRDVLSAITRPAPDPPRPQSLNPAQDSTAKRDDQRRSLGLRQMALVEVREEDVQVRVTSPGKAAGMLLLL